ncbi:hypothetical protein, partial [Pseudomonas sp.]|uniref:hypothetical protein n=1 Tax=Pseudomonas sp. TaxID=306 RepID=UPI002579D799
SVPVGGTTAPGAVGVSPVDGNVAIGGVTPIGTLGVMPVGGSVPVGGTTAPGAVGVSPVGGNVAIGGVTPIGRLGVMPVAGGCVPGREGIRPGREGRPLGGLRIGGNLGGNCTIGGNVIPPFWFSVSISHGSPVVSIRVWGKPLPCETIGDIEMCRPR